MSGALHLIPVSLGESPLERWLPADVRALAGRLDCYIAENAKTARAFLKQVGTERPLQEITIHTLNEQADDRQIEAWLAPIKAGGEIGLVSEAGCPAVADPAPRWPPRPIGWGMPSSPGWAPLPSCWLMASGLDGQRFAFHGYAPVEPAERAKQLRAWEQHSARHDQTQMLIETPYRNMAMFGTLLAALRGDTRLCVARSLSTDREWIKTRTVAQWKQEAPPDLDKQPTLFLFLAR